MWLWLFGLASICNISLQGLFLPFRRKDLNCCCLRLRWGLGRQRAVLIRHYHITRAFFELTVLINHYQLVITFYLAYFLIYIFKTSRYSNTLGSLNFVASEHPNFNSTHSQSLNCGCNLILQFILNSRNPNQVHLFFKSFHYLLHFLMTIPY